MVTERTVRETTKEYDEKGRVIKPLNQQWCTTVNTTETNPNTIKTTYTNDTDGSALSSISNAVNTIGYLEVRG